MTRSKTITQLERELIDYGIDLSDSEIADELALRKSEAIARVQTPPDASENLSDSAKRAIENLQSTGQVLTMIQVVASQSVVAVVILAVLFFADWYRLAAAIRNFQSLGISILIALGAISQYVYFSFSVAELKYLMRDKQRERFSLRRRFQSMKYWLGIGDWKPQVMSGTEYELAKMIKFKNLLLSAMAISLLVEFGLPLYHAYENGLPKADLVAKGVVGFSITIVLLLGLGFQIHRNYNYFMETGGRQFSSADFLAASWEQYQVDCSRAAKKSEKQFLMMLLRDVNSQPQLIDSQSNLELTPTVETSDNGHQT